MSDFYMEVKGDSSDLAEVIDFLKETLEEEDSEECELLLKCYKKSESDDDNLIFRSSKKKAFDDINPEMLFCIISENFPETEQQGYFKENGCKYFYSSDMGESDISVSIKAEDDYD